MAAVNGSVHRSWRVGAAASETVTMTIDRRVWFITGASRGMGVAFSKAALAAGEAVVATGRRPSEVTAALGLADGLLVVELDVTSVEQCQTAVDAAVARFGRIDVVVNNAGASFKGYFEEMSPEQVEQQVAVNLLGPMNVTRAVLPVMRRQHSGHVIAVSSGAGLIGFEYSSVYAASKAGLEGWMGALDQEVAPFGIHTTIINPGWFRTTLASPESLVWPALTIDDYAERSAAKRTWWAGQDGQQAGDPDKLARALLMIVDEDPPPRRFIAGADVLALAQRKIDELHDQIESHRGLSTSLGFDPEPSGG
jgi:NAD(P)-dependent dehydrogenase (short-subunit alcohol dehydrogenase family)